MDFEYYPKSDPTDAILEDMAQTMRLLIGWIHVAAENGSEEADVIHHLLWAGVCTMEIQRRQRMPSSN